MAKNKKNQRRKFRGPRKRDLTLKENGQDYAILISNMGDCRFLCRTDSDHKERIGIIKGSFRNRVYFRAGDYCLVSFRENLDQISIMNGKKKERCDIILKYYPPEVSTLKANGHIRSLNDCLVNNGCNSSSMIENDLEEEQEKEESEEESENPKDNEENYIDEDIDIDDI